MFRKMLPEEREPFLAAEEAAGAEIGHAGRAVSKGIVDTHECQESCGWKSQPYMDGREWAYQEWLEHIIENGAEIRYPE
jgi:hypothetical protein